jgi:hypothetical protein
MAERADEHVIQTFNMLMERIGNLEDVAQRQQRAAIFAECCKYGVLNNETLGYPFLIIRKPRVIVRETACKPVSDALVVNMRTSCDCPSSRIKALNETVGNERYFEAGMDQRPCSLGWMESRFPSGHEEAVQRRLSAFFHESTFNVQLLEQEEDDFPRLSISLKQPPKYHIRVDRFLEQIPLICKALGHVNSNCIRYIEITSTNVQCINHIIAIQYAANLPTGLLKDDWTKRRDKIHPAERHILSMEGALCDILDVCVFTSDLEAQNVPS